VTPHFIPVARGFQSAVVAGAQLDHRPLRHMLDSQESPSTYSEELPALFVGELPMPLAHRHKGMKIVAATDAFFVGEGYQTLPDNCRVRAFF
jgi:hypothetical protein